MADTTVPQLGQPGAAGTGGASGADILAALNKGGANSISAPASQEWILVPKGSGIPAVDPSDPNVKDLPSINAVAVRNPGYHAPAAATSLPTRANTVTIPGVGMYSFDPSDPNSSFTLQVPATAPNADDEMKKALDRIDRQQEMTEKQNNEAAGRGYMTNADYQKMASQAAGDKLGQDQLAQRIVEFNRTQGQAQKQFDRAQDAKDKVDAANILQTGAQTASVTQATDLAKQLQPTTIEQAKATLAGTIGSTAATAASTARTNQQIQQGNAPTVQQAPGATQLYQYTRDPNTGAVSQTGINPEFQAKTQADVAARVGQIQSLMKQKSAEVQAKVGQNGYTADQALQEFNAWYGQNVAPQQQALQAAQDDAAFQRAKDQAETQRAAYQTALGAGTNAISAFGAMQNGRVGAGWDEANAAASRGDFAALGRVPGSGVTYQAPDITKTANDAVMDALKHISPTAAQATGMPMPNYQNIDIAQGLSAVPYLPGGGPPGAPPPTPPPPASPPTPGVSMTPNMVNMAAMPGFGGGGQSTPLPNFAMGNVQQFGAGVPAVWPNYSYGG